uniref:Uncharacterized protein n=1 Tax=Chromera velia CCMP2878 TaxID=1169474 RepID=A0A0G4GAE8_9ALVE|eukprot:Cvel_20909.t1-p1 / transcript=Cvel_20909.t1 / gene=Cvel_20909 / organism=Chromera_velia_CCMP2878 / gene_product=hypothetical protein / transcript_product=hypothetical protein / location=Cvel_scaffold1918:22983-24360(-) / protein_length=77 / sequence_SO=supercontig / SO=protein_coding / is_pseudo=false
MQTEVTFLGLKISRTGVWPEQSKTDQAELKYLIRDKEFLSCLRSNRGGHIFVSMFDEIGITPNLTRDYSGRDSRGGL